MSAIVSDLERSYENQSLWDIWLLAERLRSLELEHDHMETMLSNAVVSDIGSPSR